MIHHTPSTVFCQGLLFSTVFIQCTVLFVSICLQLTSSFFQMQLSKYSGYFKNHQGTYYRELTSHSSHSSTHLRYGISRIPLVSPTIGCFPQKTKNHRPSLSETKKIKSKSPQVDYTHSLHLWFGGLSSFNPSEE